MPGEVNPNARVFDIVETAPRRHPPTGFYFGVYQKREWLPEWIHHWQKFIGDEIHCKQAVKKNKKKYVFFSDYTM